ncbi:queuosine precursor transporter [Desulfovibrio sp. JC022]|uniref:queuosine precursor transporter n=1 Tax=Desulfovibrio sp. JC022 TaxID=2593642 RepID=UPI0013D5206E|nr:queuosine precursor transporter [Desulfovibrio sp. JC022]NDV24228.1 queuosine precursor transporter [Desulfovibrio sp. JC022]
MNELLWLGFAVMDLSLVLVIYRFFGKIGLFGLIVFNLILCNIQVLKTIELFGMTTTLGNILYASVFLSTDMLSEFYGKKEAKKAVYLGFVVLVMAVVYMQLALMFTPAADDFAQPHLEAIFGFLPRIALGSMAAYIVSQLNDVYIFHLLKEKMGQRHLWLRNNASTLLSQFLDSSVFCFVALWGLFPFEVWVEILFTTYLFKVIVAVMDTPFLYLARRMHSRLSEA